jgi:hypothetical protein
VTDDQGINQGWRFTFTQSSNHPNLDLSSQWRPLDPSQNQQDTTTAQILGADDAHWLAGTIQFNLHFQGKAPVSTLVGVHVVPLPTGLAHFNGRD